MTMILRALRDSGATALVAMSPISATLLVLLVHVALGMANLETKVVCLFVLSLGLLCPLQDVLAGKRRCSGHWRIQYGALAAYYLPSHLAFYTVSAVCSASTSNLDESSFGISMALALSFLLLNLILQPQSKMRAYCPRDEAPQDPYRCVLSVVFLACVELEWTWNSSVNRGLLLQAFSPDLEWARNNRGILPLLLNMSPYLLFALAFLYVASKPPESDLDYEIKAVAEYMDRESKSSSPFFSNNGGDGDGNSSLKLDCCRYPFTRCRKDGQWISIKDLFDQCHDLPSKDKEICLSYSLSRLLARRYYGFHCAEEGDDNVRRLALAGLGTTDGNKRAFSIVEVQLAFLYDYLFTTYLGILESRFRTLPKKIRPTIEWAPAVFTLVLAILMSAVVGRLYNWFLEVPRTTYGVYLLIVAMVICYNFWLMTLVHHLLPNYWRPIHIAFHNLDILHPPTTSSIWVRFLLCICHCSNEVNAYRPLETHTITRYWRDKIGQYSLLLDYDRRCSHKKALIAWFQGLVRCQPRYMFIKHLPVEEKDIRVPDSVRKFVADTLRAIDGLPTNGTRSLKINKDSSGYEYDWSWTCRQETLTGTVLIWHIATCYCDMSWHHSNQPDEDLPLLVEIDTSHEVATTLSRYCAYLVAFLPEFLPEHNLTTKEVFQNAIQDAQSALGSTHMEDKEKHTKIQKLELPPEDRQTIFHKGVRLGRQLEKLNTRLRWKVMAEFWAETVLYVAPSDNAEAHIEHLAKGGEFVTHLWAMLSNAGILKRATGEWHSSTSTTKKAPPKKTESTKARTQECPF